MVDLIERLREWCRDWDGSEMADAAETRTTVDCRTMREAADELSALREKVAGLKGALQNIADGWPFPVAEARRALLDLQGGKLADPVFTTREDLKAWEETLCSRSYLNNPRHGHIPFVIQRVRAAHAHLLTPESDNAGI